MNKIIFTFLTIILGISNISSQSWEHILEENKSLKEIENYINEYTSTLSKEEAAKVNKFYGRWKLESYYNNYRDISKSEKFKADRKHLKSIEYEANIMKNNFGNWVNITPNHMFSSSNNEPQYGVIQDISFDKDNPNNCYVGTLGNGLLKRTQNGTWKKVSNGLPIQGVAGIVAKGQNITILSGSKYEVFSTHTGIYTSNDFGETWKVINVFEDPSLPSFIKAYKLVADPNNFMRQYALTSEGIYYTDDQWETWEQKYISSTYNLIFDPEDNNQIYYSTNCVVRKTDLTMTNPEEEIFYSCSKKILITKSKVPPYALLIAVYQNDSLELYRTFDDGASLTTLPKQKWNQLGWNWAFTSHPTSPNKFYFGAVKLYESTDYGTSWSDLGGDGTHADYHAFCWQGNTLYVGNDGGISYSSSQNVNSWQSSWSYGMKNMQIVDFDILGNKRIAGFYHNGVKIWNNGDDEADRILGGDGFECFYDPSSPNDFYITNQYSGFRKNGTGPIIKANDEAYWGQPFFPDPQFQDRFYYCNKRVYLYDKISSTFTDLNLINDTLRVQALAVCKTNSNRGYAVFGEYDDPLYFIDFQFGGSSTDRSNKLPSLITEGQHISSLIVDDLNPDKIWMTIKRYNNSTIFFSDDRGKSWTDITGNLPPLPIYCIQRVQNGNQIYVGTEFGIYYKNDNMTEWIRFSNGLDYEKVLDMDIDNGYIYASLFGSGMWRSPLRSNCPTNITMNSSNYGNPISPGYLHLEASNHATSNINILANIGTNVKLSGGNQVTLSEGFRATSTTDTLSIIGIEPSQILISIDNCSN